MMLPKKQKYSLLTIMYGVEHYNISFPVSICLVSIAILKIEENNFMVSTIDSWKLIKEENCL